MAMDGYGRAKLLGIEQQGADEAKEVITHYLEEIDGKDTRRLLWLVERSCNHTAGKMNEVERDLATLSFLGRDLGKKTINLAQYTEDFRFLYAVYTLLKEREFSNFSRDIREFLARKKLKAPKGKTS